MTQAALLCLSSMSICQIQILLCWLSMTDIFPWMRQVRLKKLWFIYIGIETSSSSKSRRKGMASFSLWQHRCQMAKYLVNLRLRYPFVKMNIVPHNTYTDFSLAGDLRRMDYTTWRKLYTSHRRILEAVRNMSSIPTRSIKLFSGEVIIPNGDACQISFVICQKSWFKIVNVCVKRCLPKHLSEKRFMYNDMKLSTPLSKNKAG